MKLTDLAESLYNSVRTSLETSGEARIEVAIPYLLLKAKLDKTKGYVLAGCKETPPQNAQYVWNNVLIRIREKDEGVVDVTFLKNIQ